MEQVILENAKADVVSQQLLVNPMNVWHVLTPSASFSNNFKFLYA